MVDQDFTSAEPGGKLHLYLDWVWHATFVQYIAVVKLIASFLVSLMVCLQTLCESDALSVGGELEKCS